MAINTQVTASLPGAQTQIAGTGQYVPQPEDTRPIRSASALYHDQRYGGLTSPRDFYELICRRDAEITDLSRIIARLREEIQALRRSGQDPNLYRGHEAFGMRDLRDVARGLSEPLTDARHAAYLAARQFNALRPEVPQPTLTPATPVHEDFGG